MGMNRRMSGARWGRALLALALGLTGSPLFSLSPGGAAAQNAKDTSTSTDAQAAEEDEGALKAQWQGRYRALRNNAVRMRENATKLRRAYGLAQHANYPRGGAREEFKQQVLDTERKADQYEAELAGFMDEARANDIPPGWIYEVDEEPIDHGLPAAVGEDEATDDSAGRNPLYADESEEEADDEDEDEDERGSRAGDDEDEDEDEDEEDTADEEY